MEQSGAIAGLLVGWITSAAGLTYLAILISFFVSSSLLTRLGAKQKRKVESDFKAGTCSLHRRRPEELGPGSLQWWGGNCLLPCTARSVWPPRCHCSTQSRNLVWVHRVKLRCKRRSYAAMNGDTWASEIGVLSTTKPRLLTQPWQIVPAGTNGGLTPLGLMA